MLVKVLDQNYNGVVRGVRADIENQALSSAQSSGFLEFFYSKHELVPDAVYRCTPNDKSRYGYFTRGEIEGKPIHVSNR